MASIVLANQLGRFTPDTCDVKLDSVLTMCWLTKKILSTAFQGSKDDMAASQMAADIVAKEALLLHTCAHRGVVPLKLVGLTPPALPDGSPDPCCVEYFAMPIADMSLDKLLG